MRQDQYERLQNIAGFCGYGNPDTSKLFFMGIEEHHHFKDAQSVYKKDDNTTNSYFTIPSE